MEIIVDTQTSILHGSILQCFLTILLDDPNVEKVHCSIDFLNDYKEVIYQNEFTLPKSSNDEYTIEIDTTEIELHRFKQIFYIRTGIQVKNSWYYYPQLLKEITIYGEAESL